MKISVFLLVIFTEMVLCYTKASTCESFLWLESRGQGSCDFKKDFCGWTNNYNWRVNWCETHNRKCCFAEMKDNEERREQLMSPKLCGTEGLHYTMKLTCEIPNPHMYTLSVYLMTNQNRIQLGQTGKNKDFFIEEFNFTLPQVQFQIIIEGQKKVATWEDEQSILILDISFHQTNIKSGIEIKSSPSPPVVTKTTIIDNGNDFSTTDLSMTTTTTSMTMGLTSLSPSITPGWWTDNTIPASTLSQSINTALVSKNETQPGDAISLTAVGTHTTTETQSAHSTSDLTTVAAVVAGAIIVFLISVIVAAVLIRRKTKITQNSPPTVNHCLLPVNTAPGHVNPSVGGRDIENTSTVRSDPENYDYVQDHPTGKPCATARGADSSTLAADDIYNHTHDSDNKQLGRHGEGGGGIYSTLGTEDTYSHLQGKQHNRFERQGHGNNNPHLATVSDDDYHHL